MFTRDGLLDLHRWTHYSLDRVFTHCAAMPVELFMRRVESFPHDDLRAQLIHVVETEHYWLWKLLHPAAAEDELAEWVADDFPSVAAIDERRREVMVVTRAYLETAGDAGLSAPVTLIWPDGVEVANRPAAFYVLHAVTHAFHHKGQVAALCRHLGHPMADTDLKFRGLGREP